MVENTSQETDEPKPDAPSKRRWLDYFWPALGMVAVVWSVHLLYKKLETEASGDPAIARALAEGNLLQDIQIIAGVIIQKLSHIPLQSYMLAAISTLVAYTALAFYDRISLIHLGRTEGISWIYVAVCSFVTYALSHNIGASVISGGMVRLRAYTAKGLTPAEVAVLVGLCSWTFVFATLLLLGMILIAMPHIVAPLSSLSSFFSMSPNIVRGIGVLLLSICMLYTLGSWRQFPPLQIGSFKLYYPKMSVVWRQYIIAPIEIMGAAGIIYFALPADGNPGYIVVLGAFMLSFAAGLLSQVPGGVGVMEAFFIAIMPGIPASSVFAALLVWRLFYLILPLALSLPVILLFERSQLGKATKNLSIPAEMR